MSETFLDLLKKRKQILNKVSTVEKKMTYKKREAKRTTKQKSSNNSTVENKQITSDQLRAIYYILFGRTSRKDNRTIAREIIQYLRKNVLGE